MAPFDWDKFMKLDVQELHDDTALADDMYCVLSEVCSHLQCHPTVKLIMPNCSCYYVVFSIVICIEFYILYL